MKNKVKRSSETLKKIRDCVQKYKVGEWAFSEMDPNCGTLENVCNKKFGNKLQYPTQSELDSAAVESKGLIQQPALGEFPTNWNDEAHPDLKKPQEKAFYSYLVNNYKQNETENNTKKSKKKVDEKKDDYKKEAEKEKQKEGVANSNSVARYGKSSESSMEVT